MIDKKMYDNEHDELKDSIPEVRVLNFIWRGIEMTKNLLQKITRSNADLFMQEDKKSGMDKSSDGGHAGRTQEDNPFEAPEVYELENQAGSLALLVILMRSIASKGESHHLHGQFEKASEKDSDHSLECWDDQRTKYKALSGVLMGLVICGALWAKGCHESHETSQAPRDTKVELKTPRSNIQSHLQKTYGV